MEGDFISLVESNSNKIIELLKNSKDLTSWDIKTRLKLSSSLLYITIGYLISQKKIQIIPQELYYRIKIKETN